MALNLASAAIVVPMALSKLSAEEAALWLLLLLIAGLAIVASFGLEATYTRLISYAEGGLPISAMRSLGENSADTPSANADALRRVVATLRWVGARTTWLAGTLLTLGGVFASARLVEQLDGSSVAWFCVAVTMVTSTLTVWGQTHLAYLLGCGHVLLVKRWEFVTTSLQVSTMLLVVWIQCELLTLILAFNFWNAVRVLRNLFLTRTLDRHGTFSGQDAYLDREVWAIAFPPHWRLGVSGFCTLGLVQFTGIAAAQLFSAEETASYLFMLRLINIVNGIALPPFYNRIPQLSRLFAAHRLSELRDVAARRMFMAYSSYVAAYIALGIAAYVVLEHLALAEYEYSPVVWTALGLAYFAERISGMHAQLFMLTNRVPVGLSIGSALVFIVSALCWAPKIGIIAFPFAYLAGLATVFTPVILIKTNRAFDLRFPRFELRSSALPLLCIIVYSAGAIAIFGQIGILND